MSACETAAAAAETTTGQSQAIPIAADAWRSITGITRLLQSVGGGDLCRVDLANAMSNDSLRLAGFGGLVNLLADVRPRGLPRRTRIYAVTLPRKRKRPLTVDGSQYYWMLKETDYGARFELLLIVEALESPNGEQLVTHVDAEYRHEDDVVTPGIVASLITTARAGGWDPSRRGTCPRLSEVLRLLIAQRRAASRTETTTSPLTDAHAYLLQHFGRSIQIRNDSQSLFVSTNTDLNVRVAIDDPGRPSFIVSYPGFGPDAASWRDLQEVVAKGVLIQGLVWIVDSFAKNGAVLPEFPREILRRSLKRRGAIR